MLKLVIAAFAAGLSGLCCTPVGAETPERVPHLGDDGQKAYQDYQTVKSNRAFVISEGGGYGTGFDSPTPPAAIQNALGPCRRHSCPRRHGR